MSNTDPKPSSGRPTMSRLLTGLDRVASRPSVAVLLVTADAAWIVASVLLHFPARLEAIFQTLVAGLTFAMIFVIQHTQSRLQAATQRKLDEILKALPGASNAVLSIETANDDELRDIGAAHHAIRQEAIDDAIARDETSDEHP
jgi:low affinity Fe/Cu permease